MTMVAAEAASEIGAAEASGSAAGSASSSSGAKAATGAGAAKRPANSRIKTLGTQQSSGRSRPVRRQSQGPAKKKSQGKKLSRPESPGEVTPREIGPQTGTLIAEFIVALVIIWAAVFTAKGTAYVDRMSKALWRSTALCGIFFVLGLLARGPNTGRVAVAFGALIDLGVIFEATQQNVIKTTADVLTGTGTGETTAQLTSETSSAEPHELADSSASSAVSPPGGSGGNVTAV